MQLHVVVGSPNSRKVLAVVDHLGLAVDLVYHDFFAGELQGPEYRALNPNGMVPMLIEGPFRLWESNAIMQYLADKAASNALLPREPSGRADVVRWQCWELAHFNRAFGTIAFEAVAKPTFNLGPTNQPVVEFSANSLRRFASVLDQHLAGRSHLVGNAVTIADYSVVHLEAFKEAIPFDWSPYPNVNAYFDRMRTNEHWARTAPPSPDAIGRKPKAA